MSEPQDPRPTLPGGVCSDTHRRRFRWGPGDCPRPSVLPSQVRDRKGPQITENCGFLCCHGNASPNTCGAPAPRQALKRLWRGHARRLAANAARAQDVPQRRRRWSQDGKDESALAMGEASLCGRARAEGGGGSGPAVLKCGLDVGSRRVEWSQLAV